MLFSRRSGQPEYFDAERPAGEVAEFYRTLAKINRLCRFAQPFQSRLPKLLGESPEQLSLLDVGGGDGLLADLLVRWAGGQGWHWRGVNLDTSRQALRLNRSCPNVAGSALALPFRDGGFDLVVSSQFTHHLAEPEVVRHLREAWRVCRRALMVSDLHRNPGAYAALALLFRLAGCPREFRRDGLISVRRGWRHAELVRLAREAGIENPRVECYFGARILLLARKTR